MLKSKYLTFSQKYQFILNLIVGARVTVLGHVTQCVGFNVSFCIHLHSSFSLAHLVNFQVAVQSFVSQILLSSSPVLSLPGSFTQLSCVMSNLHFSYFTLKEPSVSCSLYLVSLPLSCHQVHVHLPHLFPLPLICL